MANSCSACGSPLKPGVKFCEVCGTPVSTQNTENRSVCVQCGSYLKPGVRFCEICGREVAHEKPKEQPKVEEPSTMDELIVPEITEDTFASNKEINGPQHFDGFEAAVMPDSKPAEPQKPAETPTFSMDAAFSDKPKPAAVKVKAVKPVAEPQAQPQPQGMPQSMPQSEYPQPGMPIPTVGADGKVKKSTPVVPIILAILIVAVLVADAIIFLGGKEDKESDSEKNAYSISAEI